MEKLIVNFRDNHSAWEIIERKGTGHPDTLADTLAEELSIAYSKYTLSNFGAILHHNFDKLSLLGGSSTVKLGYSRMTSPIRVVINGRASKSFNNHKIPVREILEETTYSFFRKKFHPFIKNDDIRIIYELSTASTPGAVQEYVGSFPNPRNTWFEPKSLADLPELQNLNCNDTSVGCYTPPNSLLSKYILEIESIIHTSPMNHDKRIGTDIKMMGVRNNNEINLTIAIPMMAHRVKSIEDFFETKQGIEDYLQADFGTRFPGYTYNITINPLDNKRTGDVYLTHCGSCIETGDEGVVGRGNRIGGLIRVNRAMSMEGICGKNPVYHTGKVLAGACYEIMHSPNLSSNEEATIYLVGQRGKSLENPWFVTLEGSPEFLKGNLRVLENEISHTMSNLDKITEKFINKEIPLC